jgi:transposase
MPKRSSYSGKFKQTVVEDIRKNHLSYSEAMRKYGIGGKMSIQKWERIYLEEGPERLSIERRGRGSTGRPPKLDKKVEEDLISEVQRLRAENDYLKKLNALVLEKQHQNRKRK